MSKKFWKKLAELLAVEELKGDYSELKDIVVLVNESIELDDRKEEINKKLQEMNKED